MGHFDRKKEEARLRIPQRLRELDELICKKRTTDFAYLYAVRDGIRIRVCVMRDIDNKCWATAQVRKQAYRAGGHSVSDAFIMLALQLTGALARIPYRDREAFRREMDAEYVRQQGRDAVLAAHHQAKIKEAR